MKKTYGRVLAFALALALVAAMVPATPARAVDPITYIDEHGDTQTCETYTVLDSSTTTLNAGWYVVDGSVQINGRLKIVEQMYTEVNIILKDGCALTASQGIGFTYMGQKLNIYGQSGQTGTLTAYGYEGNAAIGAPSGGKDCTLSDITINGGTINATASGIGAAIGAGGKGINTVTINGGKITAKAGNGDNVGSSSQDGDGGGAGIGAAAGTSGGSCSKVIINGGTVTATGGHGAAGIGGGYRTKSASSVTINGGTVTATGGAIRNKADDVSDTFYSFGAGIGGGAGLTYSGNVTISGGTIIAIGGKHSDFDVDKARASGIGNYYATDKDSVTMNLNISGGIIYATSIDENAKGSQDSWSGVIFDGADGKVYGSPTITEKIDLNVPSAIKSTGISNYTLDIPGGSTLTVVDGGSITIPSSRTLNVGTSESPDAKLVLDGGNVSNSGTVEVYGDVEGGTISGGTVRYHYRVEPKITLNNAAYGTQPDAKEIDIANTGLDSVTITGVEHTNNSDFTLTKGDFGNLAASSSNKNFKLQPNAGLSADTYTDTITVDYTVPYGETPRTATADVSFTVDKAPSTVTAPEANTLTYTGEDQQLVKAGTVTAGGTMMYSLNDEGSYSTQIPTGKAAGSYTVHWRVDGMDNENYTYTGSTEGTVEVNIAKADSDVALSGSEGDVSVTYGESVTLTVNVKRSGAAGIALASAEQDHVTFSTEKGGELDATVEYTGDGNDTGTATVTIEPENVKTYFNPGANTVTVSYGGSGNLNTGDASITVTINKKPLDLTFTATDREYNGTNAVDGTIDEAYKSQLVGGDDVTASATATVDSADAGDAKTVNVTVTLTGDDAAYYSATDPTGVTVNISKANITDFTKPALNESIIYTGTEQGLIKAEASGLPAGASIQYYVGAKDDGNTPGDDAAWQSDYTAIKAANVGTYHVWYKVTGGTNYNDIDATEIGTVTISKQAPDYTAPKAKTGLVYTGAAQKLVDAGETEHGTIQYSLSESGEYQDSVPTGTDAKTYGVWYKLVGDDNHADVGPQKIDVTIDKAASSVAVDPVVSATYGSGITLTATVTSGAIDVKNLGGTVQFKIGGEDFGEQAAVSGGKATLTVSADDAEKQHILFGTGSETQVTAEYSGNSNIKEGSGETTVTVAPKPLDYTVTATGRDYDGKTDVTVTLSPTNLVKGDSVTLTAAGKLDSANADTYEKVNLSGITKDGEDAEYYSVAGGAESKALTGSVTVSPKVVALNWELDGNNVFTVDYTGAEHTVTATVNNKALGGDEVDVTVKVAPKDGGEGSGSTATNAGIYTATATELTGAAANNYALAEPKPTQEITINKIGASVTDPEENDLTYTAAGQALVAPGSTGDGTMMYALGTDGSTEPDNNEFKANIPTGINAGTYYVWYYVQADGNHTDSEKKCVTVTIKKAPVSFEVTGSTFPYDTNPHTAAVKQTGGQTPALGEGDFTVTYGQGGESKTASKSDVGTYDIYVTLENGNFKFADGDDGTREKMLDGKLTVTAVALELDVSASDITYGQALSDSGLSGTAKIRDSETLIAGTWAWDETDAAEHPTVITDSGKTPYTVNFTPTGSAAGNFTPESLSKEITVKVNKAELTPAINTVESIEHFSGETGTTGTLTLTGAVLGEEPKATGTFNFDTPTAGENKTVTVTGITLTDSWGDNYELTTATLSQQNTNASIGKRVAKLEWRLNGEDKSTVTYSGNPVNVTATVTNQVDKYPCTVTVADGDMTDAGTYTAAASLSDPDNYELPDDGTQTKEYTIEKSVVTFTEHNGKTTYDTNPHQVTLENEVTGGAPVLRPENYTVHYSAPGDGFDKGDMNETKAGTYDVWVQLTSETFKNYEFEDEAQTDKVGTLTVNKAGLDLEAAPVTVTYGDKLENALLDGSTARIKGGGAVIPGTWAWGDTDEGQNPAVSDSEATGYTVTFTPDDAYKGNFIEDDLTTTVKITVNRARLTPAIDTVESIDQFDGTTGTTGTLTLTGAVLGEDPKATGTFNFDTPTAGENKTVTVTDITLTDSWGDNYELTTATLSRQNTNASIGKRVAKLEWRLNGEDKSTVTYSGQPVSVTARVTNLVEGYSCDVIVADGDMTGAGTYIAAASLSDPDNYELPADGTQTKEYTIEKSVVTFEEHNGKTTYDTNPHQVTLDNTVTGGAPVLQPENYTVHYSAPGDGFDKGDMNETRAGTYDVWVQLTSETFKNYEFEDEAQTDKVGTLTVNKAGLDLEAAPVTITYGDKLENVLLDGSTARIEGGGAVIPGTWAWESEGDFPAVSDSEATGYTVTFTPDPKYAGNFVESSLSTEITVTVNRYELTPVVVASSVAGRIYDGSTAVAGGALELEDMSIFDSAPFNGTRPTISGTFAYTGKDAGTRTVNVTGIGFDSNGDNYSLSTDMITGAAVDGAITAKEVTLTWAIDGDTGMTAGYTGAEHTVTATAATGVGSEKVNVTVTGGKQTNTGSYTATASGLTDGEGGLAANYMLPSDVTQDYTISPASISFTAGAENKADWSAKGETNADPNPGGYTASEDKTPDVWTDLELSMTYDSYNHTVNVVQKAGEAAVILPAEANGFTVAYKRTKDSYGNSVAEDTVMEIRDAGTYEILVDLTPTEDGIYNYAFAGKAPDVHSLKIGEIVIEPYAEILLTWTHLKYVYHAHSMHPDLRVQNAFNSDLRRSAGYPSAFRPEDPDAYTGRILVPFAATDGSDVGEYRVTARLYGSNAGNYRIKNDTETVTIVPAPVTFTVADNVWVIGEDGTLSRDTVTLNAAWGAVSVDPDMAVHHTYPVPGTRVVSDLELRLQYRKDGEIFTEAPAEAGNYEIWAEIGNGNFRHSAAADGASHNVGELIVTDDPDSIKTYTVKFDPGYEGAAGGPGDMERVFANQTVVLPAYSGTRDGFTFQGWSYDGRIYLPNEEFHMPESDVTFKAQWLDESSIRSVGGKVLQERRDGDPAPVFGATVTLKQGSNEIGETGTDPDGVFHFERLVSGIYNLEIRYNDGIAEVVKTFLVDVEAENSLDETYILPEGALNTVVEADITAVADLESIVREASDDGIYTNRDAETVSKGGTVEFRMSITSTTLEAAETEQLPVSADNVGMTLDIELTKTVTEGGAAAITEHITDTRAPITTVIHLPPELQGKSGYTIYRFHKAEGEEEPEIQTITVSENENGEYLEVIREGTAVELHAKFYSTYVLAWYQDPEYEEPVTCPVRLPENVENGSVASDHKEAVFGAKVTLTVTPDEGYVLAGLTVTDRSGKAVTLTDNGDGTYSFIMPSTGVTVSAAFGRTACDGGAGCPGKEFSDLDAAAWYHEYTDYVIANGLMHGTGGGIFAPGGTVTRAEMVTVLWNMSGSPVVNYALGFTDVKDGHWYTEAIRWAACEGIADGYGNGEFGPNDTITRQQMATMLYRYECKYGSGELADDRGSTLPFDDGAEISGWAYEAVAWCSMKGIIVGKDDGTFDPSGDAKRSELAAVLTRYCREDDISE